MSEIIRRTPKIVELFIDRDNQLIKVSCYKDTFTGPDYSRFATAKENIVTSRGTYNKESEREKDDIKILIYSNENSKQQNLKEALFRERLDNILDRISKELPSRRQRS